MKEHDYPFIASLERLRDANDRAALAKLRRGLGKRMGAPEMYPYVVPYLLSDSLWEQERHFLVASLFAMHPASSPKGISFGAVFRRIWLESNQNQSIEKRFTNLLSCDSADIGGHLRHAVSLARSKKAPVDYHRLLYDMRYWDLPDRFVQLAWAKDFWGSEKKGEENKTKGEKE